MNFQAEGEIMTTIHEKTLIREKLFRESIPILKAMAFKKYGEAEAYLRCRHECDRLKKNINPNIRRMASTKRKLPWVNLLSA